LVIDYDWHFGIMAGLSVDVEVMALLLMQAYEVASHRADQGTGLEKRPKKRTKGSAEKGDKEGELLQMSRMDGALRRQQALIRSEVSVGGERVQATVAHLMTPLRQEVEGAPSVRWWLG